MDKSIVIEVQRNQTKKTNESVVYSYWLEEFLVTLKMLNTSLCVIISITKTNNQFFVKRFVMTYSYAIFQ